MELCRLCRQEKPACEFYVDRAKVGGRASICKSCSTSKCREWRRKNPDVAREIDRRKRKVNPQKYLSIVNKWRGKNKSLVSKWRRQNSARRRAVSRKATPKWSIRFFVDEAYELAKLRSKLTGIPWQVDHIVPLNSPIVCGLHSHTNIQVITEAENKKKKNRHWPDMPC